ncbi:hypothetical protein [Bradyrhizobium neotropicale]|uniref:hypothetical protein n=1 Tax=Bradyrhizobium neotropicale TaxID=1497615 RepID=UPI001AD63FBD|nr:hypothetical protein [Bradyrhizobium neotropicale]MBO4228536.1 hypothetical protein [Bradyrhizobium neotropicale]
MRHKIDAAVKANVALEAAAGAGAGGQSGQRYEAQVNRSYACKKQLLEQTARAFDAGVGHGSEEAREREIEKLPAKIGQPTVQRDLSIAMRDFVAHPEGEHHDWRMIQERVVDDLEVGGGSVE